MSRIIKHLLNKLNLKKPNLQKLRDRRVRCSNRKIIQYHISLEMMQKDSEQILTDHWQNTEKITDEQQSSTLFFSFADSCRRQTKSREKICKNIGYPIFKEQNMYQFCSCISSSARYQIIIRNCEEYRTFSTFKVNIYSIFFELTMESQNSNNTDVSDLLQIFENLIKLSLKFKLDLQYFRAYKKAFFNYNVSGVKSIPELYSCSQQTNKGNIGEIVSREYNKLAECSALLREFISMCIHGDNKYKNFFSIDRYLTEFSDFVFMSDSDTSLIVHLIIAVVNHIYDITVPYRLRADICRFIRNNEPVISKNLKSILHKRYVNKISSIIPAFRFGSNFINRNSKPDIQIICRQKRFKDALLPSLSIIIPVYNVAGYLSNCLESIVCDSDISTIEIICVNDGSTDNSLELLKSYAIRYDNLTVISQENRGLSAARNTGLEYASGKYIQFLDSDDCMTSCCYHRLLDIVENKNLDMLFFNAGSFYENETLMKKYPWYKTAYRKNREEGIISTGPEYLYKCIVNRHLVVQPCMYIIKKSLIDAHGLSFPEGIIHEDNIFTVTAMLNAGMVMHINDEYYSRRVRYGSLSINKIRFEHSFGYFYTYKTLGRYISGLKIPGIFREQLLGLCRKYKDLSTARYDRIENTPENFYYLGIDDELSLSFYNDVAQHALPSEIMNADRNATGRISIKYECCFRKEQQDKLQRTKTNKISAYSRKNIFLNKQEG